MSKPVLVVIDVQNEYLPQGGLPQWNMESALAGVEQAIGAARAKDIPVVLVQHEADPAQVPFFNPGSEGVKIHANVLGAAPDAPIVTKRHADSFEQTTLHETLQELGADELILCGMMTHHCVTHTSLSRRADDYEKVTVLTDACTSVNELMHGLALDALSTRVNLATVDQALS